MVRPWPALCLIVVSLTGCSEGKPATPLDAGDALAEDAYELTVESRIDAPRWEPGQWWEWEVAFGDEVADGTFCSIVLDVISSSYVLVTENDGQAKDAAAFDHPLLGTVGKDLSMTAWGDTWGLLSFPLFDGKTWTTSMPNIAWDVIPDDEAPLAMSATLDEGIGEMGGYRIVGMHEAHELVQLEYDVASGWFAGLRFYDVDPGQKELEVGYRVKSIGMNYTGPYFQHVAEELVGLRDGSGFTDVPTEGGEPFVEPNPTATFTMSDGTLLYGVLVVESVAGARAIVLTDPGNQARHLTTEPAPESEEVLFLDEPGMAGEWRVTTSGAGGYSSGYVELYEITLDGGVM